MTDLKPVMTIDTDGAFTYIGPINRAVAQLVAYASGGRGVGGSSPPSPILTVQFE